MSTPSEIQDQIEATRANLSGDVDRLSEKVAPGQIARRRMDDVRTGATSVRNRVMGSADDHSGVHGATGSVGDAASSVGSAVQSAPGAARQRTRGNPLAAGLIAFGAGWLLSSLAPASQAEKNLAETAESVAREHSDTLKQAGQSLAEDLKEPAQDAVEQVKQTAAHAAQDSADTAKSAAADVREPLQN